MLFDSGAHRWVWLGRRGSEYLGAGTSANQFFIEDSSKICVLNPGSTVEFAPVFGRLLRHADVGQIDCLFYCQSDPDVASGVPLWASCTLARVVIPKIWGTFFPHYGRFDFERVHLVPDRGSNISLGGASLQLIPAHFLPSPGTHILYDPQARLLFTGDIGTALHPGSELPLFVEDFEGHIRWMEGYHKRHMVSNTVTRDLAVRMSRLAIDAIIPHRGSIIRGPDVKRFWEWFGKLRCGTDLLNELYR